MQGVGELEDGSEKLQTFSYKVITPWCKAQHCCMLHTQAVKRVITKKNLFSISLILHLFEMMDVY